MKHLVRAGVLLSVVLVLVFVVIRVIPVPAFLAEYGFHRQDAEANTEKWANLPIQYVPARLFTLSAQRKALMPSFCSRLMSRKNLRPRSPSLPSPRYTACSPATGTPRSSRASVMNLSRSFP